MSLIFEQLKANIRQIFVGRTNELLNLRMTWQSAIKNTPNYVYVLLNTPGVGKTTLLQHFGKIIEEEGQGLFLFFQASVKMNTPELIVSTIFDTINDKFQYNDRLIEKYFELHQNDPDINTRREKKQVLKKLIESLLIKEIISINDLIKIIKLFSAIIPLYFVTDEIQEFQKIEMSISELKSETGLHFYAQFLSELLILPIFIVLSGTRYHILTQIGENIGSPLRSKVQSIVLSKFAENDIQAYIDQMRLIYESEFAAQQNPDIAKYAPLMNEILNNYQQFLLGFSGGHPRTISLITEILVTNLIQFEQWASFLDYSKFMTFLLDEVENPLTAGILPSDIKQSLIDLTSNEVFGIVKAWMMNGAYTEGQFLGKAPKNPQFPKQSEEIDLIIYNLMNMGMIVKNGNANFYLTSYFHFKAFISVYSESHDQFLRSILYNKNFQLLCGSHSGFGYVFEHILASVIFQLPEATLAGIPIPLKTSRIRMISNIKTQPIWNQFCIEPDCLYHFPWAKAIDFCILQEQTLFLLQITTTKSPTEEKIQKMIEMESKLKSIKTKSSNILSVQHWLISLYPITIPSDLGTNVTITAGDQLITLFGKELYERLISVKILL